MTNNRIMKLEDMKNYKLYRTACTCDSTDCDLTIELDTDFEGITLTFYKKMVVTSYKDNWFLKIYERFKLALKLLFIGYIEEEADFIFRGEDHIKDVLDALNSGMIQLEKYKKKG